MSAVLTAESGDTDMIAEIINECKRMGIPVLPPDINESYEAFSVVKGVDGAKDSIRFGLNTIKNFGEGIGTSIIKERKANGNFKSLSDFLKRIKDKNLNKKSLESLIKVGAFDLLVPEKNSRALLMHNLDTLLTFNKEERNKENNQDSLFGGLDTSEETNDVHLEPISAWNPADNLMWEKELLGLYISGHPLEAFKSKLESKGASIKKIKDTSKEKQTVVFGGIIEEIRNVNTKKGEKMVFLKMSDLTDSIEAVVFPKVLEELQYVLVPENCVVVKGTFSLRNGEKSVLIDKMKLME